MENKYKEIVQSGISAISKVLLGSNMVEKEQLLFFLDSYLDPYYLNYIDDSSFHNEIYTLCERVIVEKNSNGCKEEALHILHTYSSYPHEILKQNIDKIELEFLPDADYLIRREFIIDGKNFDNIEGFYDEVEKVFTKDLDWKIGRNLDAFNDILRGGFGMHDDEPIRILWINFSKSKMDLGYNATVKFHKCCLKICHKTNIAMVKERIKNAKNNKGKTLLDMIVDIIKDTDNSGHNCLLETID